MKKIRFSDRRILWAGVLIVLVLLMMDFNNRLGEMLRLNEQRGETGGKLTQLVETQEYLKQQIAYATSDVAVQEWARQEGRMIQPGDIPIVPIAEPGSIQPTESAPVPTVQTVSNWQVWEALFFGK